MRQKLKCHHIWFYVDRAIPDIVLNMCCFLLYYQFEYRTHTVGIVKQKYKKILQGNLKVFGIFLHTCGLTCGSVFAAAFAALINNFFNQIKNF